MGHPDGRRRKAPETPAQSQFVVVRAQHSKIWGVGVGRNWDEVLEIVAKSAALLHVLAVERFMIFRTRGTETSDQDIVKDMSMDLLLDQANRKYLGEGRPPESNSKNDTDLIEVVPESLKKPEPEMRIAEREGE